MPEPWKRVHNCLDHAGRPRELMILVEDGIAEVAEVARIRLGATISVARVQRPQQ